MLHKIRSREVNMSVSMSVVRPGVLLNNSLVELSGGARTTGALWIFKIHMVKTELKPKKTRKNLTYILIIFFEEAEDFWYFVFVL